MENLFDEKLRNRISHGKVVIPHRTEEKIKSTLENLPERRKGNRKRIVAASIVAICAATFLNLDTFADDIPIIQSIQKHFHLNSNYEKVMDPTPYTKESNGTKVTITNTVFDGVELLVSYKVEGQDAFQTKPYLFTDAFINNKKQGWVSSSNEFGEFKDKEHKMYEGTTRFLITPETLNWRDEDANVNVSRLPEKFTLLLQLDRLGGIDGPFHGKWNFELPIKTEKVKSYTNEFSVNKALPFIDSQTKLEEVTVTPLRILLEGEVSTSNPMLNFIVVDHNGETIKWVSGDTKESASGTMSVRSYYENTGNLHDSITVIPFNVNKSHSGYDISNGTLLNIKGATTIPLDNQRNLTITKTIEQGNKTYVYFSSEYPINQYLPMFLVDEDGKEYFRNLEESKIAPKGKESVLVFDGHILNKELKVVNPNKVYYDEAFKVKIK
ncbi:DUF4179 domain-containing protein [Bacillus sp. NEB1478]|uniref:DUF4179 domain-containing protein n=1 Tax=Bacillus sp. NEB1478 TaxID=3073816 RepID=UPI0028730CEC|nr:DUF4179 domain-containing protein [Bacillus sp. NEB1478]WNB91109.1 DUF4179 domain-containing protein [Bacillus sp. NEB1478]